MARRDAALRLLIGLFYLPLYYLILYPLVFFAGVILAGLSILIQLVTGRRPTLKPRVASDAWEGISQPVTWIFGGVESDKPSWVP